MQPASVLGWKVMELLGSSLARSSSTPGTGIECDHEKQNNELQENSMDLLDGFPY